MQPFTERQFCWQIIMIGILFFAILGITGTGIADIILNAENYGSITAAIDAIPANAEAVTILLPTTLPDPEAEVLSIPTDRGITSLTLLRMNESAAPHLPDIYRICANGIPLTIGTGIQMENISIYGGPCVSGTSAELDTSSLTIAGQIGFVFGGGFAEEGGSVSVKNSSVSIEPEGLIYFEVFGGGHAYGECSSTSVDHAIVTLSGTADYILGGSYAEDGGSAACSLAEVTVTKTGRAEVALFAGGSAAGPGSITETGNAKAFIDGKSRMAFSGDFAFDNGITCLEYAARTEISVTGQVDSVYLGSFASDEGSTASVNTAEVMNCGTVGQIIRSGQSTDQGKTETGVTAVFPCQ